MIDLGSLRLSAQRAFLGRIVPGMRLIKVETVDDLIVLTCLTDRPPSTKVRELVSDAGGEIISDFPTANITEIVQEHREKLPRENIITHGWIYERYENSDTT